ncbi:hypothetical protein AC230_02615 [Streptomyces caatingaensis]|uniref:Uncharacterized protein n=2 Tax=Streptomyces caatingaensis TaxID=1678637 RepID=A0A0K9XJR7_9ACTN|nr:hypothetical protein AC230_02615 [Streptomyces caatingaensis]
MYREFSVPDEQSILESLGEWPEEVEEGVHQLALCREGGETLKLSYSVLGRSVRVQWVDTSGKTVVDLFKEGATRLAVTSTGFTVSSHMGECTGEMVVEVFPVISVTERVLFT